MARRSAPRHVLVIPDGSRRHARRAFLCDLLGRSSAEFRLAMKTRPASEVTALEARLQTYSRTLRDPLYDASRRDLLDVKEVQPPLSYLLDSYRQGTQLIDAFLRWILDRGEVRILSAYGMQARNLERSDEEVTAFLRAETECANRWADNAALLSRCTFRFIGDRGTLERHRNRSALVDLIDAYLDGARELEKRSQGRELRVNILAPYDPEWEIKRAIVRGGFDRQALAVPEPVDFVVRSGNAGRSLTSGALPLQAAYSQFASLRAYFPDCSLDDLKDALERYEPRMQDHGL